MKVMSVHHVYVDHQPGTLMFRAHKGRKLSEFAAIGFNGNAMGI